MDCPVCVEPFNKSSRKPIQCPFCPLRCCLSCCKRYVLEQSKETHCMGCKHNWDEVFISSLFPKSFVSREYKIHKQNLLLEWEKQLLPSAQAELEKRKQVDEIRKVIHGLYRDIDKIRTEIRELEHSIQEIHTSPSNSTHIFNIRCPDIKCRGFLTNDWVCGICSMKVCSECREPTESEHKCDPGMIDTIKHIQTDSKPCPNCGIPISKIDGCNQMFCVECHTAFDWESCSIINGVIHNPHYFEWRRQNNYDSRNPVNVQCGGIIFESKVPHDLRNIYHCLVNTYDSVRLMRVTDFNIHSNLDLRILFLDDKISEEDWRKELYKRHIQRVKDIRLRDIRMTFVEMLNGLFIDLSETLISRSDFISQNDELVKYCNEEIRKLETVFNCKMSSKYIKMNL